MKTMAKGRSLVRLGRALVTGARGKLRDPSRPRLLLLSGLLILAPALLAPRLAARPEPIPVIDLHVDLPYRTVYKQAAFAQGSGQFVANKLLAAGVRGVVLPLFVPHDASPGGRTRLEFERSYAAVFQEIVRTPPYSLPGCDIHRAGGQQRPLATWLAFEGSEPLGADESEVRRWALRGVRSFGLVHSEGNRLADSSGRGPQIPKVDRGLSDEGRRFIELVHKVGGVVDVSHASDAATDQAIQMALAGGHPIMATHSNARALAPHTRNLRDDQIRGIAQSGGVVGVNFHQPFLRRKGETRATLADVVDQVRYLRDIGGISAVALGSDFEGGISAVSELSDATRFERLSDALLEAGLSRKEVRQIFFENAKRVLCGKAGPP